MTETTKATPTEKRIADTCCVIAKYTRTDPHVVTEIVEAWMRGDVLDLETHSTIQGGNRVSAIIQSWDASAIGKKIERAKTRKPPIQGIPPVIKTPWEE